MGMTLATQVTPAGTRLDDAAEDEEVREACTEALRRLERADVAKRPGTVTVAAGR